MANEIGTGSFPTMGTSAAVLSNVAKPIRGRSVVKNNSKGGSAYPEGSKANRGARTEHLGATLHPVMSSVKQNAPEASAMRRNVQILHNSASATDNFRSQARRGQ